MKSRMHEETVTSYPPARLAWGNVVLEFAQVVPADPVRELVPYYHFRILTENACDAGFINFRLGDSERIMLYAGHIGYEVFEPYRGNRLALAACQAIGPFVRTIYESVIITCNPDNEPSRRTIELLGGRFLNEIPVPPEEPAYISGSRAKRRYDWKP